MDWFKFQNLLCFVEVDGLGGGGLDSGMGDGGLVDSVGGSEDGGVGFVGEGGDGGGVGGGLVEDGGSEVQIYCLDGLEDYYLGDNDQGIIDNLKKVLDGYCECDGFVLDEVIVYSMFDDDVMFEILCLYIKELVNDLLFVKVLESVKELCLLVLIFQKFIVDFFFVV